MEVKEEHLDKLLDISHCTGEDFFSLEELAEWKALDYRYKDLNSRREIMDNNYYYDRAVRVITEYYKRKFDYHESWIE